MNWPNGFPPDSERGRAREREREGDRQQGREGSTTDALELKQQFSAINYGFFIYVQSNDASRNHYHDNAGSFPRQQHNQREFPNAFSRSISHALYTRWEDCAIVRSCISISTLTLVLNRLNIWIQIKSDPNRSDSWVNGKVWVWILN